MNQGGEKKVLVTGIGSLPHINTDSALSYSFRHDIAFLPQLPKVNKNEYMIYQSMYSLPGITKPENSMSFINLKEWARGRRKFLEEAQKAIHSNDYSYFLPDKEVWSCLNPFIFELDEQNRKEAKLQLCGPFTCVSSLKLDDHTPVKSFTDLVEDIELCFLLSANALLQKFKDLNIKLFLFIDEPGLIIYSPQDEFLKKRFINLQTAAEVLKKQVFKLGIHCCSDTKWELLFSEQSPFDYVSFDLNLSGHQILKLSESVNNFCSEKNISIGLIPTDHTANLKYKLKTKSIQKHFPFIYDSKTPVLYTAACGLAHAEVIDAEDILNQLHKEADEV
jgi:hypothetical protein